MSEVINSTSPRYMKHPPSGSPMWKDGKTLDSGTAIIMDNNLSLLSSIASRHLITCFGQFEVSGKATNNYGFDGLVDVTAPADPATEDDENSISWSRDVAYRFGPFIMPMDKELSDGRKTIRDIVFYIGLNNYNGTDLKCLIFATPDSNPPRHGYLATAGFTDTTTGASNTRVVLEATSEFPESSPFPTTSDGRNVFARQVYLWVGFQWNHANSNLLSVNAFEVR